MSSPNAVSPGRSSSGGRQSDSRGFASTDITNQSPLAGAQLNLRTLTIAQRLAQSPSQEAMFYSIGNRLNFLQTLEILENDLTSFADDLPILVDGEIQPPLRRRHRRALFR